MEVTKALNYCTNFFAEHAQKMNLESKSSSIHTATLESIESECAYRYIDDVYKETFSTFTSSSAKEFIPPKDEHEGSIHNSKESRTTVRHRNEEHEDHNYQRSNVRRNVKNEQNGQKTSTHSDESYISGHENNEENSTSQGNEASELQLSASEVSEHLNKNIQQY